VNKSIQFLIKNAIKAHRKLHKIALMESNRTAESPVLQKLLIKIISIQMGAPELFLISFQRKDSEKKLSTM
jgi:hypothetical protein